MDFAEFFKAKGRGDAYNRWPAGAPSSKGGQFAPGKQGGGLSTGSLAGGFFSAWANALSGKSSTKHIPSKDSGSQKPAGGQKIVGAQFGGTNPSQQPLLPFSGIGGYGGSFGKPAGPPKGAKPHPKAGDKGETITINYPSKPSAPETWKDKDATATFTPGGDTPKSLHGVAMKPWKDAPTTPEGWNRVTGQNPSVDADHPFEAHPTKHTGAGVMVIEKDGRIWLTKPTNHFGGYQQTFPKGTVEDGINLQASAIKEAFEETGLQVKITGILGDFERTTSKARYYIAERVGGTPKEMGWESQAIRLATFKDAKKLLNNQIDKDILDSLDGEMSIGKGMELSVRAAALLVRLKGLNL